MGRLALKQTSVLYCHFLLACPLSARPSLPKPDCRAPGGPGRAADPPFPSRTSANSAPQCFPSSARLAVQVSCAKQKRIIQYTKTRCIFLRVMARARCTSSRPRRRSAQDGLHACCSSAHRTTAARKWWSSCSPSPMSISRRQSGCVASPCTAALASSRSKGVRTGVCACATCPGLTPPCSDIFLALATSVTDVGNTRLGAATPEHVAKIDEIAFYSLTSATWDDLQAAADALPSPSSTEYADAGGSGAYAAPPPFEHPCSPLAKVRPPARSRRPAAADARRYSRRATSTSRPRRTGTSPHASRTVSAARRTRAASRRASCGTSTSCAGCSRSAARSRRPRAPS
jgi:hypothetical protein